jgi:hypothetical protein
MRTLRLGLLALALGLTAGCGPKSPIPAKVSGKVTYNGNPVQGGNITFHSKDRGSYSATLGEGGVYEISALPDGELVVTVETESINPNKKTPAYGGGRGAAIDQKYMEAMKKSGAPINTDQSKNYVKIPAKYAKEESSGLTVTLKAGKQTQDFPLTD